MFNGSAPTHQLSVSSFECVAYASLAAFVNFSVIKVSFRSKSVYRLESYSKPHPEWIIWEETLLSSCW